MRDSTTRSSLIFLVIGMLAMLVIVLFVVLLIVIFNFRPGGGPAPTVTDTPTAVAAETITPSGTPVVGDIITAAAPVNIEVILDGSVSMNRYMSGQTTKMQWAQNLIGQLFKKLPENVRVGVRVYGHRTGATPEERAKGCQDVELFVPIGQDKAKAATKVNTLFARGYAPLALALQQAELDFKTGENNVVILIGNAKDNCDGDPVAAAKQLRTSPSAPILHVIGFGVDGDAKVQLQQVAQEGGGKYIDAQSEHELASALRQAVNMAQAIALAAPTPTLVPGAATPTPAGPTNTPRPTNTPGPTSTPLPPTKTPTPTVTLTPHAYPKPVAKGPAGGSEFGQFTAPIPLEWEWDSMLGSDEYFDIVIWRAGHEDENVGTWAHCGATAPSITMQKWEICEKTEVGTWRWFFRPPSMGTYTWKVRVVRGILDGKQRRAVAYLTEDSGSTTFQVLPPTPTFTPTPLPTATETSTPYPTNTPHP